METDNALAARLAHEAGMKLRALQLKGDLTGAALGKAGDEEGNAFLMDALRRLRPDDAILSEEEKDSAARLSHARVWIVDPLDGTREYSEGRDDWAVHVALAVDGVAVIGAVALPGLAMTLSTDAPPRLGLANAPLKMLVSRTRPAKEALAVAEAMRAELLPMGSAGAKAMAVVRGAADIYLHTGGQYEWDNCAPVAVAHAAGLHVSRVDGSPMRYNNADTYIPDLLICRAELADTVLRHVAALG
jgi:3'(2'), 5'-bisphosphate nucleotidase